jgi:N-acetylmuramoyl-L-alanine amidase
MIIIDNGHGIETPGKRSPVWENGQLLEWQFNRNIALRIQQNLKLAGIDSILLVPEDSDISLPERVHRANKIVEKFPNSFGISIHANADKGVPGTANGWEIWTSKGQTQSDILATYLYKEAEKTLLNFKLRKDTSDGDVDKESNFYILRKTNCPFVLTENGFMDNHQDCQFMMSETGKQIIALVHAQAILKYLIDNPKI